jgi:diaminopimelate epimerase
MDFTKMQGAGNDFVVIQSKTNRDWSELAVKMCDRHFGIGADGLLISLPSKKADFKMRIFNADGSESAVCGNGLRCLVKYYIDNNHDRIDSQITVETSIDVRPAKIHRSNKTVTEILVNMGTPAIGLKSIPVKTFSDGKLLDIMLELNHSITIKGQPLKLSLVSVGNPHAVHFNKQPVADFPLVELGSKVEQHKLFPDETNFEVVNILNRKHLEARVWERGVGETLACGSGACAIMVAGRLLGDLDDKVEIKLPGGILKVEWDIGRDIFLSGPAETVFTGKW